MKQELSDRRKDLKIYSITLANSVDPDQALQDEWVCGKQCRPDQMPQNAASGQVYTVWLIGCVGGLTTRQLLWVILCRLPEKGRKEIEETVEMKERDRVERWTGMKVIKQKK